MLIPRWWRASVNVAPSIGRAVWSKQSFICRRRNTVVNKLKNTSIVYIHFVPALSWSHLHRENWVYSGNTGHKGQFRVCNLHIDAFLYLKDTLDTGAVRLCLPLFHTLPPCEHHSPKMGSDKTPGRLLHLWEAASASGCLQHCLLGNALLQHKKRNHHSCSYQLKKEKRKKGFRKTFLSFIPGEKMSGLKRMSKEVLLIEPTALQAFRTTSLLLGSVSSPDTVRKVINNSLKL